MNVVNANSNLEHRWNVDDLFSFRMYCLVVALLAAGAFQLTAEICERAVGYAHTHKYSYIYIIHSILLNTHFVYFSQSCQEAGRRARRFAGASRSRQQRRRRRAVERRAAAAPFLATSRVAAQRRHLWTDQFHSSLQNENKSRFLRRLTRALKVFNCHFNSNFLSYLLYCFVGSSASTPADRRRPSCRLTRAVNRPR